MSCYILNIKMTSQLFLNFCIELRAASLIIYWSNVAQYSTIYCNISKVDKLNENASFAAPMPVLKSWYNAPPHDMEVRSPVKIVNFPSTAFQCLRHIRLSLQPGTTFSIMTS